jgi:N-methylhydantoinase A
LFYGVDLKYVGQFHEVTIPFASPSDLTGLQNSFDAQHRKLYGYNLPGQPIEALHWRLTAVGRTERPFARGGGAFRCSGKLRAQRSREVVFESHTMPTHVYEGGELPVQATVEGPAVIEEPTTTIVVPPGSKLVVNDHGDYELSLSL